MRSAILAYHLVADYEIVLIRFTKLKLKYKFVFVSYIKTKFKPI